MTAALWERVDAMIDSAPGVVDLRAHGLHLLAARRWRMLGRPVAASLVKDELRAAFTLHNVLGVLREIRAACDGPVIVLKGPVVSALYPDPALRPFYDLDLLVPNPVAARQSLLASGFQQSGDPRHYQHVFHHEWPVRSPNFPVDVELHSEPKWVGGLDAPPVNVLLSAAEPAALDVDDILTLSPAHHALVLAAHLWAHDPLARFLRVVDVALMAEASERRELNALADAWGMARLWHATMAIADALLVGARPRPWSLRTWGRSACRLREPSVFEVHLGRCIAPFWVLPPYRASQALGVALSGYVRRQPGEPWRRKLRRTGRQLARPSMRRSEHVRSIESE